jgi:phage gpG-like protein
VSVLGLQIEYKVGGEGGDTLTRMAVAFERAGAELADLGKNVFPLLPPVFASALTRQFDGQGVGPVAGSWSPLSAVYEEWKSKRYPGQPILVATGSLREGLTAVASPFGAREWSASEFVFGTRGIDYASFHQSGTRYMPARPPFDLDAQFEVDLSKAALEGVRAAVKEANLDTFVEVKS